MSKCLCLVIGCNYIKPMLLNGDIIFLTERLKNESKQNTYLYILYEYNSRYDVYMPYAHIRQGILNYDDNYLISGVSHRG